MGKRVAKPARVSEVLAGYMQRAGIAERVAQAGVLAEWPGLVGERMAAVTEAAEIRTDGVLVVRVRSAPWAQELSMMTPQIMARINAGRRVGRVSRIHWVVER
jgi:predicted nucleic acid-binding Zn ribbon protein